MNEEITSGGLNILSDNSADYSQQLNDIYDVLVSINQNLTQLNNRPVVDLSDTEEVLGQIKGELTLAFGSSDVPESYYNTVTDSLICICFLISLIFGVCVFCSFHRGLKG